MGVDSLGTDGSYRQRTEHSFRSLVEAPISFKDARISHIPSAPGNMLPNTGVNLIREATALLPDAPDLSRVDFASLNTKRAIAPLF